MGRHGCYCQECHCVTVKQGQGEVGVARGRASCECGRTGVWGSMMDIERGCDDDNGCAGSNHDCFNVSCSVSCIPMELHTVSKALRVSTVKQGQGPNIVTPRATVQCNAATCGSTAIVFFTTIVNLGFLHLFLRPFRVHSLHSHIGRACRGTLVGRGNCLHQYCGNGRL